jgi:hypothetical protein
MSLPVDNDSLAPEIEIIDDQPSLTPPAPSLTAQEQVVLEAFRTDPLGTLQRVVGGGQGQPQQPVATPEPVDPFSDPAVVEELQTLQITDPMAYARRNADLMAQRMAPILQAQNTASQLASTIDAEIAANWEGNPQQLASIQQTARQQLEQLRQTNPHAIASRPQEVMQLIRTQAYGQAAIAGLNRRSAAQPNLPVVAGADGGPAPRGGGRLQATRTDAEAASRMRIPLADYLRHKADMEAGR